MENTETVMRIIRDNTDYQGEIYPGDHLQNDLHLDSFDIIMVIRAVEDKYSICVEDENLNCIKTVADIARQLDQMQNA